MKDITKKYSNEKITVVWKPRLCIHSAICFKGLPMVFNPQKRPWVAVEGASTAEIINQVNQCPSGALSYYENDMENKSSVQIEAETKMEVMHNGPLLVYGNVSIKDANGNETKKNKVTAFCRCGQSKNKPFCDGSHVSTGFQD